MLLFANYKNVCSESAKKNNGPPQTQTHTRRTYIESANDFFFDEMKWNMSTNALQWAFCLVHLYCSWNLIRPKGSMYN